jgi:hypothetical protein
LRFNRGVSPGAKLTVFMVGLTAVFFALRWVLARILGAYPEPSRDRPSNHSMPMGASDGSTHFPPG